MEAKEIVILLTNKGYVAIEGAEIFDLWTNKSLKDIYEELKLRYSAYKIHLGSMDCIDYQLAVEVANQYLTNCNQLESIKPQNINHKNYNNMKASFPSNVIRYKLNFRVCSALLRYINYILSWWVIADRSTSEFFAVDCVQNNTKNI